MMNLKSQSSWEIGGWGGKGRGKEGLREEESRGLSPLVERILLLPFIHTATKPFPSPSFPLSPFVTSYFSISGFCSCPRFFILSSKRWPFFPLFTIDVSVVLFLFFFSRGWLERNELLGYVEGKEIFFLSFSFLSLIFQSIAKFSDNDLNIIFGRNFLETHLLRASVRSSTKKRDGKRLEISSVVVIFRGSRTIQLPRDDQRRG